MPHFTCPACKVGIDLQHPDTRLYGCPKCGALLDFSSGFPNKVDKLDKARISQLIPLGTVGVLRGLEYTVIAYTKRIVDHSSAYWAEYVLMNNADRSIRFLSASDGHWLLVENIPMEDFPEVTTSSFETKTEVKYEAKTFELFSRFSGHYTCIIGEIPWELNYKQSTRCLEFINPPQMISFEMDQRQGRHEINAFRGIYIYPKEVKKAFLKDKALPPRIGIAPAQPFLRGLRPNQFGIAAFVFCLVALFSFLYNNSHRQNKLIMQDSFYINDSTVNKPLLSPSFRFDDKVTNIEVQVNTDLTNNWCALDLTLVNEVTGEERTIPLETAYYRGVEDGESWSEGDYKQTAFVCSVTPGQYHFVATTATEKAGPTVRADVTVFWDVPTVWNEVILCLLFGGAALVFMKWQQIREDERWENSDITYRK
ncbi:protein of unknown function [Chitinophaga jiangningensis]|uniref:DUF4178 domain-containing protein n=1 Tax=Chitinophaga jiangningensis TaxID=1419482 RepID=A0A1M7MWQ0_9BACT|nr:DUF4178 domain-containing protein [Chitinophaga jiangningensis]SHM95461.1 protein of unknown function [Chitinophaga jiangningensis]